MHKVFEVLSHTADIKIRVWGTTPALLFKHALLGMFTCIDPQAEGCRKIDNRIICDELPRFHEIYVEGPDVEALLVNFLSEALCLSDIYNEAYFDVIIHTINETSIRATLYGVPVKGFEVVEIKAVTYHGLAIKKIDAIWQTDIVFDI